MRTSSLRCSTPGFTLLEVQVALLLIAMIAVVMAGALRLATQTWDRVTIKQDVTEHRFLIIQALRKQLGNMRFIRIRTTDGELVSSFLASRNSINFVAPFPTFASGNDLYWWTLTSAHDIEDGSEQLVLRYRPFSSDWAVEMQSDGSLAVEQETTNSAGETSVSVEDNVQTLVIADGVSIEKLDFLKIDQDGAQEWLDDWGPVPQVPQIIRLTIKDAESGNREIVLPEIAIKPRFADQRLYFAGSG